MPALTPWFRLAGSHIHLAIGLDWAYRNARDEKLAERAIWGSSLDLSIVELPQ